VTVICACAGEARQSVAMNIDAARVADTERPPAGKAPSLVAAAHANCGRIEWSAAARVPLHEAPSVRSADLFDGVHLAFVPMLLLHHLDALDARLDAIPARNGRHVPEPWHV